MTLLYITNEPVVYSFNVDFQQKDSIFQSYLCIRLVKQGKILGLWIYQIFWIFRVSQQTIFLDLESQSHYRIDAEILSIDGYKEPNFYVEKYWQTKISLQKKIIFVEICLQNIFIQYLQFVPISERTLYVLLNLAFGGITSLQLSTIKCQSGSVNNGTIQLFFRQKKSIYISEGWTFTYTTDPQCGNYKFLLFNSISYYGQLPPHQHQLIRFYKRTMFNQLQHIYTQLIDNYQQIQLKQIWQISLSFQAQNTSTEILIRNHPDPILRLDIKTLNALDNCYIRDFELFILQLNSTLSNECKIIIIIHFICNNFE
ncbi:unnamed protein product (macronuclear) [Paramecium tetraurelia]|uniref:Uncharacterized protein n=1 Tax=Paramecium tetraurelia TaxID=5888 RepID=A0E2Z4_PARTE|nr:uncharacterized protein GSPATT00022833001 [Paramecium tetraurelia]CAK89661.1 unnamed protein product [Paramecium tetraurelia]|eukprot:XP_001457058.1 hypothetical protein (macronuclear) [Paramecium tetraurelia strain d4-2]